MLSFANIFIKISLFISKKLYLCYRNLQPRQEAKQTAKAMRQEY